MELFSIDRDVNVPTIARYLSTGKGVLTTSGTQAMGFFVSDKAKEAGEEDWPDVQIILAGVTLGRRFGEELARGFGPRRDVMLQYLAHAEGKETFLQIVSLGRPHARGRITLGSIDPYVPAVIDPNYLSNQHDIGRWVL
jgi:choline dehydrogenase-like flavoprotein